MKIWWIISRTFLFALLMMSATLLYVGSMEITKYGASEQGNTLIIILKIAVMVLGISLVFFERKYSKKFKLKGTINIVVNEIVSLVIVMSIISYNFTSIDLFVAEHSSIGTPLIIAITFGIFFIIALLPSAVLRIDADLASLETKQLPTDEWIRDINHRYDTRSGSIYFQTKYINKKKWLKGKPWRELGSDIKADLEFRLSRPLASMSSRERESCRVLELMEVAELSNWWSQNLRASMIWANGKGTVDIYAGWKLYKQNSGTSNSDLADSFTGVVEWFIKNVAWHHNFDSAVAGLLQQFEKMSKESPSHPAIKEIKSRLEGGNSWLLSGQFNGSSFASSQPKQGGIFLGNMPDGNECWFTGEGAIMTIAPPGSGKTQTHIIPNLLKWRGSAVVLDVKGELWDKTAGYRAENVGEVYRFAPLDPDNSHHFNPLLLVRNDEDHLWEDAKFLADLIVVKGDSKDPFWENKARELITSAIAVECMDCEPEKRDMSKVIGYCYGVDWNGLKNKMVDAPIKAMQNVITSLINIELDSSKVLENIRQQAQSYLSVWEGAKIERSMKESDWHPNDLRDGNITLYIALKAGEIATFGSLLRVFIAQHLRTLIQDLPSEDSPDILFMLDEFPRLKHMSEIEEALEIGRQFKIKLFLAVQSIGQVQQHYKNADGLIGACAIRAFMNPSSQDGTAEKISNELGFTESIVDGTRKKIAEPTDLAGAEYVNNVVVLASGSKPIRANKSFAYQDSELQVRMDIPPSEIKRSVVGRLLEDEITNQNS